MISNLERIARVLKLQNVKEEDNELCLKIQDEINKKDQLINKLQFMNKVLKSKVEQKPKEVMKVKREKYRRI